MVVSCRFFGIKPFRFQEAAPLPEVSEQPIHGFWMIFRRFLLVITLIAALPFPALVGAEEATAAADPHEAAAHGDAHNEKHHGLPKPAPILYYGIGGSRIRDHDTSPILGIERRHWTLPAPLL